MEMNEDYELLKEEYQGTQVYEDFVSFMDFLNPDWRKEKELGEWAPEFCLGYIHEFESVQEEADDADTKISFKAWLAQQYLDICERYADSKNGYQSVRLQNLYSEIDQEIEANDNELTQAEYDLRFELLRKKDDEKIYLNF
jgi:hypothetical protein